MRFHLPPPSGENLHQRREEVPAAHPEPAEERAQQLPGVPEEGVQATEGAAEGGTVHSAAPPDRALALGSDD